MVGWAWERGLNERDDIRRRTDDPLGILHVRPPDVEGLARYWPSRDLEPFVEHYWAVRWDEARPERVELVPQPAVHLVLERGASEVVGLSRSRFTRVLEGQGRILGTRFRPGAFRAFVDFPVRDLADRRLPLANVLGPGAGSLEAEALAHGRDPDAIRVVEEFLRRRQPVPTAESALAARIVDRITSDRDIRRVDQLSREFGLGLRALQRLFGDCVGASPKRVILGQRLLEAADRATTGAQIDWVDLALDLGFADQAHLIREFKKLVGRTPADYVRGLERRADPGA